MDEQAREFLLAQVLKKKAIRDQRRIPRPANFDIVRFVLQNAQAGFGSGDTAVAANR